MNKDESALLASWLGVGIGAATLLIASVALIASAVALLSVDQVKRVVCRELTLSCGFDAAGVNLVVVDAERHKPSSADLVTTIDDLMPPDPADVTAWDLLARQAGAVEQPPYDSAEGARKLVCVSVFDLLPLVEHGTTHFQGADWTWAVNFSRPVVAMDSPNKPSGLSPKRTVGFEFDATYAQLHNPVAIKLHLKAFKDSWGTGFRNIVPILEDDYDITLPAKSHTIEMVCPFPQLAPGPYHMTLQSHSAAGDWEQLLNPIDLQLQVADPLKSGQTIAAPKSP